MKAEAEKCEYQRQYYAANKERKRLQRKAYRDANKEKIAAQKKACYEANRDKTLARRRELYAANRAERQAKSRAKYAANAEKREANKETIRAKRKAYYHANKKKIGQRNKAYRDAKPAQRIIIAVKQFYGCQNPDCMVKGQTLPWQCLECHHIDRATKAFNVSNGRDRLFADVVTEINKCIVLCANCHKLEQNGLLCVDHIPCCQLDAKGNCKQTD